MKMLKSFPVIALAAAFIGMTAQSCSDDIAPDQGEGLLKMKMIVNSEVTRADVDETYLADNCVIYISSPKGLIHKFKGLDNVPSDLWLKSGSYVAEAWTGDSVSASFDKKFYRAYEPFTIHQGVNNVVINCKIANVVASVNRDRVSSELLPEFKVTVANTKGELVFDADNINDAHGYFMMPNGDTKLTYTIEGVNMVGTKFTKSGEIPDVQRAHEYVLNLNYNEDVNQNDVGGAFITISVDDTELLIEDNIIIHSAPKVTAYGMDITAPITGAQNSFDDILLGGVCYGNFKSMRLAFSDKAAFGTQYDAYELMNLAESAETELRGHGVIWSTAASTTDAGYTQMRMKIPAAMLNGLANGSYWIDLTLTDANDRTTVTRIAIEVSDASVIPQNVAKSDIRTYSALVKASIVDTSVANPGIRFRAKGSADWTESRSTAPSSSEIAFRLTNLQPSTTYEVQAVADGYVNNKTVEFTTEAAYAIPNASFEDWSTYSFGGKNVPFPGTGSATTFWSSGNAGSMTMNKSVTTQSSSFVHSGSSSVKLESQFVGVGMIGKFAAGNLFAGEYVKTDGTDGVLLWGREMPSCHPVKLVGYANYRPATVQWAQSEAALSKGDMDKGTVYVAVTTKKVDIRTKSSDRALFDKNADYVLAYGQVIWDGNFGADNTVGEFEIPLEWKNANYDGQMYIIIVASASLYGDYFTGGNSVMYLDDLSFTYE